MKMETVLTVSQSKRLIARGVKRHPAVKTALNNGIIGICRGTTCSYVAEEFLGHEVEKFAYTTGLTLPPKPFPGIVKSETIMHDVLIRHGEIHQSGETVIEAAKNMKPGDVIIKGANALNYKKNIAGCLIGHPVGGTVGGFWGPLYGMKIRLVIPVGLEKEISSDIVEVSSLCMEENPGSSLMPMTGIIITEIEAIKLLTGAEAFQIAAGGIRGAEGSVRLLIHGSSDEIKAARSLFDEIREEPPY
ncbi:hypothetical protein LLG96_16560 [bacterium]|nr:hypothetical protein [bacterium]